MSTLNDLLRQVEGKDAQLAADLRREVEALESRRAFGLNFERHVPETVELPGRTVRRGDKVRFLPVRGEPATSVDKRLWRVKRIRREDDTRVAELVRKNTADEAPETASRVVDDLIVVAEFRDPIYPGLVSTGKVERGGDKPYHTVINAENFHALQALLYTHEGKVDAIYIDPPYNTGAKDWKYNNDYVDGEDAYRHSKWLAFMERRLKLAKRLLNPENSVLIVTIDEKEYLRLGLLLEQAFENAELQMVSSVINQAGSSRPGSFSRTDEYLFFVKFGKCAVQALPLEAEWMSGRGNTRRKSLYWNELMRTGPGARRQDSPNLFFPIYLSTDATSFHSVGEALLPNTDHNSISHPEGVTVRWPIRSDGSEGRWRVSPDGVRELIQNGYIRVGRSRGEKTTIQYISRGEVQKLKDGVFTISGRRNDGSVEVEQAEYTPTVVPGTQWNIKSHDSSVNGAMLNRALIPRRRFPFPKSLYAVEDGLRFFVADRPDATIIDFFAGSGTSAHAVMRLNKQDDGHRQCISVTNNEVSADEQKDLRKKGLRAGDTEWEQLGICDYITKPRLKAAITGETPEGEPIKGDYKFTDEFPMADGFEENVEFFTMTYEAPRPVAHHKSFAAIAPLLWLKAGAQGRRIDKATDDFAVADTYGVLFDLDAADGFLAALAKADRVRMAFIVTDNDRGFQAVCADLPGRVEPVRLYESYLTNFTLNTGRG